MVTFGTLQDLLDEENGSTLSLWDAHANRHPKDFRTFIQTKTARYVTAVFSNSDENSALTAGAHVASTARTKSGRVLPTR